MNKIILPLGTPVTYTATFTRKRVGNGWRSWAVQNNKDRTPQLGVLVGYRTISSGTVEWDESEGYTWIPDPTRYERAALVAFHLYRSPVLVPLSFLDSVPSMFTPIPVETPTHPEGENPPAGDHRTIYDVSLYIGGIV